MMVAPTDISLELCYASPKSRSVDPKVVDTLAASIEELGLLQPITVRRVQKSRSGQMTDAFEVIAGMHRVKAFRRLGRDTIPAVIADMDDLHAEMALIDENLQRSDLTAAERSAAQARRKAIYQKLHPETVKGAAGNGRTKEKVAQVEQPTSEPAPRYDEAAAATTGQSPATVRRDVHRGEALGEDVLAKVARTSLDKGEELDALVKLTPETRAELIDRAVNGETVSAKHLVKKEQRENREKVLAAVQLSAPQPVYGCILEDYEWDFEVFSRETGMDRHAGNHYPVSDDAHTAAEIVKRTEERMQAAAKDCILGMWTTVPHLAIALDVMRLRGFTYKSSFVWCKDKIGTGYWNRNKHEIFLIGTRGNIPAPSMGTQFESVIIAPRGEHSVKPDWQYEFFERHFPNLPKIELNARRSRPGWDTYGLEAPENFGPAAALSDDKTTGEILPPVGASPTADTPEPVPQASPEVIGTGSQDDQLDIPPFLRRESDECVFKEGASH